ncbi:uncharacterized protein [Neodiprion pinetum]|uniref:uncharacterized protein isoform X1 n=2 Tax=Neodiprion pinetum TaxID=441929 RepID=UPI00371EEF3F
MIVSYCRLACDIQPEYPILDAVQICALKMISVGVNQKTINDHNYTANYRRFCMCVWFRTALLFDCGFSTGQRKYIYAACYVNPRGRHDSLGPTTMPREIPRILIHAVSAGGKRLQSKLIAGLWRFRTCHCWRSWR